MSRSIDERVVQMQFDNRQFESGVSQTLGTLGRLKDSLNFGNSSKGLDQLQNRVSRFNFDDMMYAVDGITNKFSAFGTFANRLIENLADSVYNFGVRTVKAMSIDNVTAGWRKFDELTKSTATLVSQGNDLEVVNAQLERLNWFTDETSYNFTDMVSNIGKFTASGQGLEESVDAMEGIATWAALSGQNAATASRAMYQLSQAMGKGALRYDDWRSIQNASMDTIEFRRKAAEAATTAMDKEGKSAATLLKISEDTYKILSTGKVVSLNDLFTSDYLTRTNWLSSDVMMQTFKSYSSAVDQIYEYVEKNGGTASEAMEALGFSIDEFGLKAFKAAQEARSWGDVVDSVADAVSTGWMNTFKYIFGNYEEATKLWTAMANELWDVFASGGERRNEILSQWHELGGYNAMIEGFANVWNGLKLALDPVNEALGTFFGYFSDDESVLTAVSKQLVDSTKKFRDFTAGFKALFDTEEIVAETGKVRVGVADLTAGFDDQQANTVNAAVGRMQKIRNIAKGFVSVLDTLRNIIHQVFEVVRPIFKSLGSKFVPVLDKVLTFLSKVADKLLEFNDYIKESNIVYETLNKILNKSKDIFSPLADGFTAVKDSVLGFLDGLGKKIFTAENATTLFDKLKNIVKGLAEIFDKVAKKAKEIFGYIGTGMKEAFSNGNGFETFMDIVKGGFVAAGAGGILGILKKIKDFISEGSNITDFFGTLNDALNGFVGRTVDHIQDLRSISVSMIILAGAVAVLSMIDQSRLQTAISAIGALMLEIFSVLALYNKFIGTSPAQNAQQKGGIFGSLLGMFLGKSPTSNLDGIGKSFIGIAIAVGVMALAVKAISKIKPEDLGRALGAITLLFIELGAFAALMASGKQKYMTKGMKTLVGFAAAVFILAQAVKSIAKIDDPEALGMALGVITTLIIELGALAVILAKTKSDKLASVGLGSVLIAASMLIFYEALKKFASMKPDEVKAGLLAMGGALAEIAVFMLIAGRASGKISSGVSMAIIAGVLLIIINVMNQFAKMDGKDIGKSLGTMAGALLIMIVAMKLMKGSLGGAAAMLVMAAAIGVMTITLKALGKLSLGEIGKSLLMLAGALAIFLIAGALATAVAPGLLALSASMLAFSASIVILGIGLIAISAGVSGLAVAFGLAVEVIVGAIIRVVQALPQIVTAVGDTIVAVLTLIRNVAGQIPETLSVVLIAIIQTLEAIALVIIQYVPGALVNIINAIAEAIRGNAWPLLMAVGNVLSAIIELVITGLSALAKKIPGVGGKISEWLDSVKEDMSGAFAPAIDESVDQIDTTIDANADTLHGSGDRMFGYIGDGAAEADLTPQANEAVDEVVDTVNSRKGDLMATMSDWLNPMNYVNSEFSFAGMMDGNMQGMIGSVDGAQPEMYAAFQNLIGSGEQGALDKQEDVALTMDSITDTSITQLSSKQPEFFDTGSYLSDGIVEGMRSKLEKVGQTGAEIALAAYEGARNAVEVNSPSRKFMELGMYLDQGLAIGLTNFAGVVEDASENVASRGLKSMRDSITKINDFISNDVETTPVIAPILDLSGIQNGSKTISGMLSRAGLSIGTNASRSANSISNLLNGSSEQLSLAGAGASGNQFVFTQNNYSPKALSNIEIYRQTKNQFATMKKVLDRR